MITRVDTPAQLKKNRFQALYAPGAGQASLMIVDYKWWAENEREILNWMNETLPRGIEHQQGMCIMFDNTQDRLMFLMRWGG
jgi:hypothetical protein